MPEGTLRNSVAIVGVGESDIGKVPGMTGLGLNAQAAMRALEETGLKPSDIDGLLTAYSFTEPYFMLGSVMCEYLGITPRFNASVIVGGGSPAVMLKHAAEAIAMGQAETALICAGFDGRVAVTTRERRRQGSSRMPSACLKNASPRKLSIASKSDLPCTSRPR